MKSAKPVSIVLPSFCPDAEVEEHLIRCTHQLFQNTPSDLYDLIVVENGSIASFNKYGGCLYVHSERPLGYARAVNIGLKLAKTEYVCVLNNDVFVPAGWLETMLRDFDQIDRTRDAEGKRLRCGVLAPQEGPSESLYTYDAHWWALTMFRKSLIDEIGTLDEEHLNARYADQDFNIRARKAGYQIVRTGNVIVEHVHSATYDKIRRDDEESREKHTMQDRWGVDEFAAWVERNKTVQG